MSVVVNEEKLGKAIGDRVADRAETLLPALFSQFAKDVGGEVRYALNNRKLTITIDLGEEPKP